MEFKKAPGKKADQSFIQSTQGMRHTTIAVNDITVANMRIIAYGSMHWARACKIFQTATSWACIATRIRTSSNWSGRRPRHREDVEPFRGGDGRGARFQRARSESFRAR